MFTTQPRENVLYMYIEKGFNNVLIVLYIDNKLFKLSASPFKGG